MGGSYDTNGSHSVYRRGAFNSLKIPTQFGDVTGVAFGWNTPGPFSLKGGTQGPAPAYATCIAQVVYACAWLEALVLSGKGEPLPELRQKTLEVPVGLGHWSGPGVLKSPGGGN